TQQPPRAPPRFRLRQAGLCATVFGQGGARSFVTLPASEIDQRVDRASRNTEGHGAKTGIDTRRMRECVPRIAQHEGIVIEGGIGGRYESMLHHDIVAPGSAQSPDVPGIHDFAVADGTQHEPQFRRTRRRESRLTILMDDAHEDKPATELAATDQRPTSASPVTTIDNLCPSTGAGAV